MGLEYRGAVQKPPASYLDGGVVNTVKMKHPLRSSDDSGHISRPSAKKVQRANVLGTTELPDVKLMNAHNSRHSR